MRANSSKSSSTSSARIGPIVTSSSERSTIRGCCHVHAVATSTRHDVDRARSDGFTRGTVTATEPAASEPVEPMDWLARFAELLGVDAPDQATVDALLELAGVAAHASQRTAAPIACFFVGRAGVDPAAALDRA